MVNFRQEIIEVISSETLLGCEVLLLSNGIIEVHWNSKHAEITVSQMSEVVEAVKKMGQGKKMPIYTSTYDFMNISPEGKKYAASAEANAFTIANAVLIDNMAKRLVFNFFVSVYKPAVPTRGFPSKEDAMRWLLRF